MKSVERSHVHTAMNNLNAQALELARGARAEGFLGGMAVGTAIAAIATREWGLLVITACEGISTITQRVHLQDYEQLNFDDASQTIRSDFLHMLPEPVSTTVAETEI